MRYLSHSSFQTKKLGALLASKVLRERGVRRGALVIALEGELGSGKTTFIQGFFKGLGKRERPQSPTFIIMRRTPLRREKFRNIFHLDAYRLKDPKDLYMLGFDELLRDPQNIALIEWADRVRGAVPKKATWVKLRHVRVTRNRAISIL